MYLNTYSIIEKKILKNNKKRIFKFMREKKGKNNFEKSKIILILL